MLESLCRFLCHPPNHQRGKVPSREVRSSPRLPGLGLASMLPGQAASNRRRPPIVVTSAGLLCPGMPLEPTSVIRPPVGKGAAAVGMKGNSIEAGNSNAKLVA